MVIFAGELERFKVIVNDRGNSGKTPFGNGGSLSSQVLLAVKIEPVNDPPTLLIPTPASGVAPLSAEEDRLGVVGIDCCGWSTENILDATVISNSSIVLSDIDVSYETGGTSLHQPYKRWTLVGEQSTVVPNDTMTVKLVVSYGGVLMSDARSEVSIQTGPAITGLAPHAFFASLELNGPLWAVADALKGLRYRSELNWNSWVGAGEPLLQPIISEVRKLPAVP